MTETFRRFDAAEFLEDKEDVAAYFQAAVEDGDPAAVITALGTIARARNMSQLARDAGITREGLYKALSPDSNPGFTTVARIAAALGFSLSFARAGAAVNAVGVREPVLFAGLRSARTGRVPQAALDTMSREAVQPAKVSRAMKTAPAAKAKAAAPAKPKVAGVRSRRPA